MARLFSRRTQSVLLTLLALFLLGTVIVLSAVRAYFSIDQSAYIEAEELGTWDEIRWGSATDDLPLGWAARYPWLAKMLSSSSRSSEGAFPHSGPAQEGPHAASPMTGSRDPSLDALEKDPSAPAFDNTPKPWSPTSPKEKIPRIIHQTWKDSTLPGKWQAVREECQAMHPDYEYMLWTDADSRKFLVEHYSWFVPIFDAYPYAIQRADAIRYFVLHKYGGIYMDLDVGCLRRFDPLLRFEVVLPKTIPVGVSNDIMLSAKGHPFMDQLIHNLVTFNHRYLTNYPTVMFSTGPMFVSASYRIYVDAHGPAIPSSPSKPAAGFEGVRVLPKSLYGKNAKPGEAPNAFFKHFYGSSWHANDAGFLILLRDYGKGLMLIGAIVVAYGFAKTLLPRLLHSLGRRSALSSADRRRRRGSANNGGGAAPSSSAGRWISLPIRAADARSSRRAHSAAYGRLPDADNSDPLDPRSAHNSLTRVAAPRPQRYSLPMFDLADGDGEADTSEAGSGGAYADEETNSDLSLDSGRHPAAQGLLSWVGSGFARPPTASSEAEERQVAADGSHLVRSGTASKDERTKPRKGSSSGGGTLYLPAFFVGGSSSTSSERARASPTETAGWASGARTRMGSDESAMGHSRGSSLGTWAAGLLPPNWRAASPSALATVNQWLGRTPSPALAEDVERIGSGRAGASFPMTNSQPSGSGRYTSTWSEGAESNAGVKEGRRALRPDTSHDTSAQRHVPAIALDMDSPPPPYIDASGTSNSRARHEQGTSVTPSLGESSASAASPSPSVSRPGLTKRPSRGSLRETAPGDAAPPSAAVSAAEIGARSETPPVALVPPPTDAADVNLSSERTRLSSDSATRPVR